MALDVEDQRIGVGADASKALLSGVFVFQNCQLVFESGVRLRDAGGDAVKLFGRRGGDQAWSGGHKGAAVLRNPERGHHLGNAAFIYAALNLPDAVERKPADKTCGYGQRDGSPDPQIELHGDTKAAFEQALQSVPHDPVSRMVSIG